MSSARCRQIVLGIGNAERGDDAAGTRWRDSYREGCQTMS